MRWIVPAGESGRHYCGGMCGLIPRRRAMASLVQRPRGGKSRVAEG